MHLCPSGIEFLVRRVCGRHIDHSGWENCNQSRSKQRAGLYEPTYAVVERPVECHFATQHPPYRTPTIRRAL
jgi:hypothetical protein